VDTRERLLEAARDLLLDEGLAGFSMRKVGAACNVSATAIYRHFDDRAALVSAAVQEGFRIFASYLDSALSAPSPLERFRRSGQSYFDFAREHGRYYALLFLTSPHEFESTPPPDPARQEGARSFDFLVERIAECQHAGVFVAGDPRTLAACVWASVHGLVSLTFNGHLSAEGADLLDLQARQIDLLVEALLRRK
jgi:AcrR family transcriptional regulator